MPSKPTKKVSSVQKKTNPDIYRFIDFFVKTGEKILGKKPNVVRGKDGMLVSYALRTFPVGKLETLAVWFLVKKKKLRPLIGTMLSHTVLDELMRDMNHPGFWKEIDSLMDQYYPRMETPRMWQPFSYQDITTMKEDVAKIMRRFT
ncbi:MAG: hypothetical protein COU90_04450 [Candidatus Ryanbacteria bacterium CG10_big_fil_rev_8_21_14_0_10_43_42]|uniref:Uncharacterized protein n=1 Tax=Candidatus Ryanbacteria bacterium CG10_big_fil_rev_8_21_14_0_10_43_42 TaxID=1974864 RepID=A0A2M8KW10_9BACT|nr:MAG: hypothetical protein COU90_04450 [Candidatus Ryanbacteria bacterium CG10_big_fil_rev_8_21_14_0_10_43_42]